jgi:hypothetical protein
MYWMASQALWRVDPKEGKGLDATFAYDWSPPNVNRNNTMLTAGLRFNEPLPLPTSQHHVARLCTKQSQLAVSDISALQNFRHLFLQQVR